jgi:small-conductance mechanosensitive channel
MRRLRWLTVGWCVVWLTAAAGGLLAPSGVEAQQPPASPPAQAVPGEPTPAATPGSQPAPEPPPALPPEVMEPISRLSKSVENAEKSIQQLKELEGELQRLRADVERIIYDSTAAADSLRPQLAEVKSQIEKLGPPPGKDQPPESPTVAAERARLNALAAALDGAVKTTELAWVRAKQLIDRITVIRYQIFTRNLFERRDSPILPGVWRDVGGRMDAIVGRFQYYGSDWLTWAMRSSNALAGLTVLVIALYAGLRIFWHWVTAPRLVRPAQSPSFFDRVMKAAWMAPARMLPGIAATSAAYIGLSALDLLFSPWEKLAATLARDLFIYTAASALLGAAFWPGQPAWRLVPVSDAAARRILWLLRAFVGVYVLDTVLVELGRALYVPLSVTVAQTFLVSLLFFTLLVALLLTPFEPQTGPDRPVNGREHIAGPVTRHTPLWIKLPLWLVAIALITASLLGYVALGRFIAHQLVLSGMVLAGAGLLYLAVRAATRGRADGRDLIGNVLEVRFGLEGPRRVQISRLIEFALTFSILLVAAPALMLQWGFSAADIRDWSKALLFGFEVGQFRISLIRILFGISLFIALLFLTRLVQRWLRDKMLTQPRMDVGVANSIETSVGYAGTAIALLLAVSYAGFDVTSLAIVAGALSVGIGFGLQSIVNNFVSGLILLVERPIKVGDWIVVGSEQGNVRRISVRSTEIETFDRASLIIPNSELVTGRVLNWTHRNQLGRSVVKITVDAAADPERVIKILKAAVDAHPEVLTSPAPSISFDSFSSTGLEFTIRATLADVYRTGAVATDLRIAILRILREEGITFRNPQYDIHLRDLDVVKAALNRVAAQRAAEAAGDGRTDSSGGPGARPQPPATKS